MTKTTGKLILITMLGFGAMTLSMRAAATIEEEKTSNDLLKFDVGVSLQDNVKFNSSGVESTMVFDPGVRFGLAVGLGSRQFGPEGRFAGHMEFESGLIWNGISKISTPVGTADVDGNQLAVPLLLSFVTDYNLSDQVKPFIGIGGGAILNTININEIASMNVNESAFNGAGAVQWQVGVAYTVCSRAQLALEYKGMGIFGANYSINFNNNNSEFSLNHSILAALIYKF